MKRQFKRTTKEEFDSIKLMQKAGLKPVMVAKITKRSYNTISDMFKADTYVVYRAPKRANKLKSQVEPKVADDGILKLIHDKLSSIDTRLKFIEENIEIKPKRKFFN